VAGEVNSEMPTFWVRKVTEGLNEDAKPVRGSKILVVGAAYKKDIDDLRESPALDIIRLLLQQGAKVSYHDPYVQQLHEDGVDLSSVNLTSAAVSGADCVLIATDHSSLDYAMIRREAKRVVDTRNALGRIPAE
jgi:UDP-N-acetyl-D-glucosamine dehydrogenase